IYTIDQKPQPEIELLTIEQEQLFKQLLSEFVDFFANEKNEL
ncbi:6408_t:CDS:1, partial [Scutellospora calospora]